MRLGFGFLIATATLAACAHPAPVVEALPPNPYGYLKPSAVCDTPPVQLPATGSVTATMRLNNDGGFCKLDLAQSSGGPFASFLVTRVPAHGSPLLYNYNGKSRVTYTPTGGYLGPDGMTVEMVPGPGQPRVSIDLSITVSSAHLSGARS